MKIYEFTMAPNPRRVRVFLAEKGINVPYEQVDLATAANRKPEFLKINPMGGVPVLELDDGTHIAESVAICRYFEETKPDPRLMGVDAKDKAVVEMWNRRMEFEVLWMTAGAFRNTSDFFKGRIPQVKEYGEICRSAAIKRPELSDGGGGFMDDGGRVPQHQRFLQGTHPASQGIRRDLSKRGNQTAGMARHGARSEERRVGEESRCSG